MLPNVTDLTEQQQQVIDLYLSGKTTGNIAKTVGVNRQTLWRWRQLPQFQAIHHQLQHQRREEIREHMVDLVRLSLNSIERELNYAQNPLRENPIATALSVLKLLQGTPLLADPETPAQLEAQPAPQTLLPVAERDAGEGAN